MSLKDAITVGLPKYLASLPVPEDMDGLKALDADKVFALLPVFLVFVFFFSSVQMMVAKMFAGPAPDPAVNRQIELTKDKVVNFVEAPTGSNDKGEKNKLVMCRCWKSKTFPYCDGSHVKHNKETGDNVGPLIVKQA